MRLFEKLRAAFRPETPNADEVRRDVVESSERMTGVEASLASLRIRLDVMTHQGEQRSRKP